MGDLHQGHARLVKSAREGAQFVALSIFVNPLQFTSEADLGAYPRVLERDRAVAQKLGVDVVFAPTEPAMFPGGQPGIEPADPIPSYFSIGVIRSVLIRQCRADRRQRYYTARRSSRMRRTARVRSSARKRR